MNVPARLPAARVRLLGLLVVLAVLALVSSPAAAAEDGHDGLVPGIEDINPVWYIAPLGAIVALAFALKVYRDFKETKVYRVSRDSKVYKV